MRRQRQIEPKSGFRDLNGARVFVAKKVNPDDKRQPAIEMVLASWGPVGEMFGGMGYRPVSVVFLSPQQASKIGKKLLKLAEGGER